MSLSRFIRDHHEAIIREFADFAETLMPPGPVMSVVELRDHAEELLTAIVLDMQGAQSHTEQRNKSRGGGTVQAMAESGKLHADARIQHGFSLEAVIAEFRALRAAVLRLYESSGESDLIEVRRFNEAVDEALTESMNRYAIRTESLRDQFVGILGHDLRTPLAAILTGTALVAVPEDHPQRRMRVAASILNSAHRMQRMIADLLDLTRAKLGGAIPITREATELRQICEEVMSEIRAANPAADLRLETHGDLSGDWDADRLAQVVSNLAGNAIQHGAGTRVTVSAKDAGDRVELTVHNGGPPIPAATLPLIFETLVRGQSAEGGSPSHSIGLGLFIARAVVTAHAGEIEARSSADRGTTFTVNLPRKAPGSGNSPPLSRPDA